MMGAGNALANIAVPPAWERITFSALRDVILVIGASNTGKSTLARYLYHRLGEHHERRAFVDGDMGQASLGPPTTMTLALSEPGDAGFPPPGPRFRAFAGDISPRGHMLPTVVGMHRLVRKARDAGATAIVVDTTGLVHPDHGGGALKWAKVNLLRPSVVIGIQRQSELEHLLVPLRVSGRPRVIDRRVAPAVRERVVSERRAHRAKRFRRYFEGADTMEVEWRNLAVVPRPSFSGYQLVALEDQQGFVRGLGIVIAGDANRGTVHLRTPLDSMTGVDLIRLGDVVVDPRTYRDQRIS
jgi:polynucleotide 5'-hydroxyl-kinase GRC3/NOL9